MVIKFSEPQEFVDELEIQKQTGRIDQPVRFTTLLKSSGVDPIRHLVAVATALVSGDLLYMEYPCGGVWSSEDNPLAQDRVARTYNEIDECCKKLSLELHGGMYERP